MYVTVNEELMTTKEVAEASRAAIGTVRYWRHAGIGPKSFRIGRRVIYRTSDVNEWLNEQYETAG